MRKPVLLIAFAVILLLNSGSSFAQSRKATQTLNWDELVYANLDQVYPWELPQPFKYPSPFTGNDTVTKITGFGERFSSPFTTTYIDSIVVGMEIDRLDSVAGNEVLIEARPELTYQGKLLTSFSNPAFATIHVLPGDLPDSVLTLSIYPIAHAKSDSDFFISVRLTDTAHAHIYVVGDSVRSKVARATVEDSDRSRLYLWSPLQAYMANTYWGGDTSLHWYPNFMMIAYVSSPTGSVAEIYPTAVDPLTFFVERTVTGEIILHFTPESTGSTRLDLFDENGREVACLLDAVMPPQPFAVQLPTNTLASGRYFCKITTGGKSEIRRIAIAR